MIFYFIDINECEQSPKICDQRCTDLTPGYQCSCNPGYHLDLNNKKSCIGIQSVIITNILTRYRENS